ncbi:MAG: adenine phosphoribosyltransferase [Pseudolysinimonas sp.]
MSSAIEALQRLTMLVPNFPEPGIMFRDLTPVFADPDAFAAVCDALTAPYLGTFDVVAGVEARGFVLAAAAARAAGVGVVLIRKGGKLPRATLRREYALEYGTAVLEVHPDDVAGRRVLLVDDVLATGGTLCAALELLDDAGAALAGVAVAIELDALGGRSRLGDVPLTVLQHF